MPNSYRGVFASVALLCAMLIGIALVPVAGTAQTFRGTILGTVTDASGASVGGAKVTIRNTQTGLTRETETSADGSYAVPELPIGTYTVTVEKAGFQTSVTSDVRVDVAVERRVDATLQPGAVTQRVTVSGEALPQVETTTNVLGGVMEPEQVTNLPVNGRDYTKLIYMVPGIAGSPDQITDSPGSFGVFSMNGARGRANNFLLDGTDMNDGYRNDPSINEAGVFGDPATILPLDAVAELRVASNYEPEFGRNAGAIVNIVTKSGTNDFHGTALEFFRNNWLDARNFFNTKDNAQNPFRNNQFGGSLGGPIVRDKTFFFVDYEGEREGGAQTSLACVPTPAQLAGATDPVARAIIARKPWPAPNVPNANLITTSAGCTGAPFFNLVASTPFKSDISSMIAKVDHNINKDNLLSGRYYFGDSTQSFPLALTGGGQLPGFNTVTPTRVQLVSISWVSVLSGTKVNEARVGWNRFAEGFFPEDQSFNPASIGLNTGVGPQDFGLPRISVSGFAPIGADKGDPRGRVDTNWQFFDNFSWKSGRHDVKFGYEFRRTSISQIFDRNFRGKLSFGSLSAFLAGTPSGGSQARGGTNRNTFENNHAWYVQDSFRWTPRLTVNYGIRWDFYGVIEEKHGLFANFDPVNGFRQEGTAGLNRLYEPDYKDFAPRVSLAYDLTGKGKTVIRVGYGIFYDAFSQDFFMGHLPFASTFDPGSAYSGFGRAPISFGSFNSSCTTLGSCPQVYSGFGTMPDFFAVDRHIHAPYMQNYNLNVEQALGSLGVLQIGYVGSNGHRLFRFRDINQASHAAITAADLACTPAPCIDDGTVRGPFATPTSNPFNPGFFYLYEQETASNSNYNSLQLSFRLRNWRGLTSQANYVWSRSIDDASDGEDFVPHQAQPADSTNAKAEKGNSSFDIRNRFVWNFIYEFPKLKGTWSKLTDGWGFNGVLTLQSGQPFHLIYSEDDFDGSANFFARPDVVGPIRYNRSDPTQFLDLTSFAVPCTPQTPFDGFADTCTPGTRHFGNLGRNSLKADDFRQFDFAIFKNTSLTERVTMQIRAEFYNLANHPNFTNPLLPNFFADGGPICATGVASVPPEPPAAQCPRLGHSLGFYTLASTADVGIGNPFLGGGAPRTIQLAVRFTF